MTDFLNDPKMPPPPPPRLPQLPKTSNNSISIRVKEGAKAVLPSNIPQFIVAIAALISAFGGGATLQSMFSPDADIKAMRKEVTAEFKDVKTQITRMEVRQLMNQENSRVVSEGQQYLKDYICLINKGRPHGSFECNEDFEKSWKGPPNGNLTPLWRTTKPFPTARDSMDYLPKSCVEGDYEKCKIQ